MIIRLRSRDGLERVELPDAPTPTIADLRAAVLKLLDLPSPDDLVALSTDARLLTAKTDADVQAASSATPQAALLNGAVAAAASSSQPVAAAGLAHGAMLFVLYRGERAVPSVAPPPQTTARPFGARLTVDDVAARTVKIERQDKAKCASVSFDRSAADAFQRYVQGALGFSRARAGILYGSSDDQGNVRVEWVYEPPQEGSKHVARWREEEQGEEGKAGSGERARADAVAAAFGLRRVGWVLAQAHDRARDCILSDVELRQAAQQQHACGDLGVTVLVTWDDGGEQGGEGEEGNGGDERGGPSSGGHVHFEAFQCSEQAVRLWREGWFAPLKGEAAGVADPPPAPAAADAAVAGGSDMQEQQRNGAAPPPAPPPPPPPQPRVGHTLSGKRPKSSTANANANNNPSSSSAGVKDAPPSADAYAPSGTSKMQYPRDPASADPVLVSGKGASEVDNDFFLCPVKILDHEGPLMAHFPVENRLVPQTRDDLRAQLRRLSGLPYEKRLADAHLLLWLSGQPNLEGADAAAVCAAAAGKGGPLMEGYRVIIDSIAGV
jgi:nuclear protein localization protein 4 homolog